MDPKTPLLVLHLFGVVLGLGAATVLDVLLLRSLREPLDAATIRAFETVSKLVAFGIGLLWLSGLGFLTLYQAANPALLLNPKLWAKIAIVVILTANGVVLHARVLPVLRRQIGRRVFEGLPSGARTVLATARAISAVSWYVPFLLGVVREFNFAAPIGVFLGAYLVLLAFTWCGLQVVARWCAAAPRPAPDGRSGLAAPGTALASGD